MAGADEVGRGCFAGPLVVAAVVLNLDAMTRAERRLLGDLDDSKRLRPGVRGRLADAVWAIADQVVLVTAGPSAIDRDGLHRTNLRLLASALGQLTPRPALCLVDGFDLGGDAGPHRAVRRGDRTSAAIAAASVVAKVARDRAMIDLGGGIPSMALRTTWATPRPATATRLHASVRRRAPPLVREPGVRRVCGPTGRGGDCGLGPPVVRVRDDLDHGIGGLGFVSQIPSVSRENPSLAGISGSWTAGACTAGNRQKPPEPVYDCDTHCDTGSSLSGKNCSPTTIVE